MNRTIKFLMAGAIVLSLPFLGSCGGVEGVATPTSTTTGATSDVTFNVSNTAASISVGLSTSKDDGTIEVGKAAAVSSGSVRCVSRNSDGTKTTVTGTLNGSGNATCSGVPVSKDTICYLLNSSGTVLSTFNVSDSKAMGGGRDGFTLPSTVSSTAATVNYNGTTGSSTATCSDCAAPTSGGSSATDLSGTWKMNCNAVKVIGSDAVDSSQSCPSDLNNQNVFLHRVAGTDSDKVTRYGYGAWPSQVAFTKCGSTEGLQSLPSGWALTTTGQAGDFSWGSPFASFSASSTSAQILTMIQATAITDGASVAYATYSTSSCTGMSGSQCAANYYWAILSSTGGGSSVCWPDLRMTWTSTAVTFAPRTAFGGTTQPRNRYDFMSTYTVGDQTYMKSFFSEVFPAYDLAAAAAVNCLVQDELLVSFTTPSSTATGTTAAVKFANNQKVTATSGVASQTTTCQAQVGANSTFSSNGTYVDVTMTKQ